MNWYIPRRRKLATLLPASAALLLAGAATASAAVLDLKVLLISGTGGTCFAGDYAGALMKGLLDEMGVPYRALNVNTETLTPSVLVDPQNPNHGFYNGIILTDTEVCGQFDATEWQTLYDYERTFGVREVVMAGYPTTYGSIDYGMAATVTGGAGVNGKWASGTPVNKEVFEYVNPANDLPLTEWVYLPTPVNVHGGTVVDATRPTVQPLLVNASNPSQPIVSVLRYPDGRRVMLSTVNNASWDIHSQVLAYEFLNFATKGVFLGARYAHLAAHNDDLFLPDEVWDPATNTTPVNDPAFTYRLSDVEFANAIVQQNAFRAQHPTAKTFKLDFAYNASRAGSPSLLDPAYQGPDLLTIAVEANMKGGTADFRYINHTFRHLNMNVDGIPEQPGDLVPVTDPALALSEIAINRQFGTLLGLQDNRSVLVSGEHSGLREQQGTSPLPYPWGKNDVFLTQVEKDGVTCLAFDSSQPNQAVEHWVAKDNLSPAGSPFDPFDPSVSRYKMVACPRYPTSVFYNVTTPTEMTDEYNWVFHERYKAEQPAQDPCLIPAAICEARTYEQILAAEAETALRHILTYKMWPHFFHQTNLRNYEAGKTLQFDWLEAVVSLYEKHLTLPLQNLAYHEIGNRTRDKLNARALGIQGAWNTTTNAVTITSNAPVGAVSAKIRVTGVTGGTTQLYGGQRIGTFTLTPNGAISTTVDRQVSSLSYF